jgi:hypothetical protein
MLAERRRRRALFLMSKVATRPDLRVIDIGCGSSGRSFTDFAPAAWDITGIDILPRECVRHAHPGFHFVRQNVKDLDRFADGEFDLAVSIGMLEHVTAEESYASAVAGIPRIARQYAIIVPARWTWIEPHYGVPLFPVLPYALQIGLVRAFNLAGHRDAVRRNRDHIRIRNQWRSNAEYLEAFPGARILRCPTLETILIVKRDDGVTG